MGLKDRWIFSAGGIGDHAARARAQVDRVDPAQCFDEGLEPSLAQFHRIVDERRHGCTSSRNKTGVMTLRRNSPSCRRATARSRSSHVMKIAAPLSSALARWNASKFLKPIRTSSSVRRVHKLQGARRTGQDRQNRLALEPDAPRRQVVERPLQTAQIEVDTDHDRIIHGGLREIEKHVCRRGPGSMQAVAGIRALIRRRSIGPHRKPQVIATGEDTAGCGDSAMTTNSAAKKTRLQDARPGGGGSICVLEFESDPDCHVPTRRACPAAPGSLAARIRGAVWIRMDHCPRWGAWSDSAGSIEAPLSAPHRPASRGSRQDPPRAAAGKVTAPSCAELAMRDSESLKETARANHHTSSGFRNRLEPPQRHVSLGRKK